MSSNPAKDPKPPSMANNITNIKTATKQPAGTVPFPTGNITVLAATPIIKLTDELLTDDTPNFIPSVWSEQEVAVEKWSTKGPFEDPDGLQRLNRWFTDQANLEFKRIGEIQLTSEQQQQQHSPIMALPSLCQSDFFMPAVSPTTGDASEKDGTSLKFATKDSVWSKYYATNKKILSKPWAKHLIASWHLLFHRNMTMPWDMIYPKGRDGLPIYNPSGKYFVKIFWFGAWRKVIIDDRIPIDARGYPLLPLSPGENEIWPLLISKALLKTLSIDDSIGFHPITSFIHAMTSWLPEALCLGDAVNAMQKDVFSPIDRDSIRLAITMDDYLEGIPVLIEKSVEENNEITFFAAFSLSKRNENSGDSNGSTANTVEQLDFKKISHVIYLRDPGQFKASLKYQTSLKEPGKSDASYSSSTYIIEREDYGSSEDFLLLTINHGGVLVKSDTNNCSVLEVSEYSVKNGIGKELVALDSFDSVNTIKVCIKPEERFYRLAINRLNSFTIHIMALNSGLTIKEECISTDHHKQPVFDREEIIPGYNAKIWTVLFKTVLRVNLPTNCTFQLFTPNLLWGCTKLKLVDNDSQKVVSDYPLEIRSCSLIANNNGYTLMAESKPPVTTLTGKIKLRIFGVINPLPVVGAEFSSKSIPQDIDGNYVLNKQRTLFSWTGNDTNYLSIHVKLSDKDIYMRLKISVDEKEILAVDGKGMVTIPCVFLPSLIEGSKSRYILHAFLLSDDSNIPCLLDGPKSTESSQNVPPTQRPITPSRSKTPSHPSNGAIPKKKRNETGLIITELLWNMRLVSSGQICLMLTKDTTQEERYKAVKFGWETTQPGRSTKARDSREAYLKSQASTSARNSDISLNIPDLDVLNYPEWRAKKMEAYQEFQKSMNERFNGGLLTVKKSREFQLNTYQQINQENFDISRKIGEERASYRKFLKDASDGLSLAPAISVRQQPAVDQPVVVTTEPKQPEDDLLAAPTDNTKNNKKKPAKK